MMRPEAFRYRGNTGNAGYGFDQVQDQDSSDDDNAPQQPLQNGVQQLKKYNRHLEDQNPNAYHFLAPGNKGSLKDNILHPQNAYGSQRNK